MDLFEQAGIVLERIPIDRSEEDERDDPEFTSRELLIAMDAPVAMLADWFYSYIDIDPDVRLRKTRQLKQIIRKRGLSLPELGEAWEKARDEIRHTVKERENG